MPKDYSFWDHVNEKCHDIAPEVGALTGAVYTFGTEGLTDNAGLAKGVGSTIGDFVAQHWGDTCDLPKNIGDSLSNLTPADSSPAQSIDASQSQSSSTGHDL